MKTYLGNRGITPRILDLGTRWRWVVSFTAGRFIPREKAPGTHWIGGWVGLRAVLDVVVNRKIPSPRRELNSRTPIIQPIAQRYTDWAIVALFYVLILERNKIIPPYVDYLTAKLHTKSTVIFFVTFMCTLLLTALISIYIDSFTCHIPCYVRVTRTLGATNVWLGTLELSLSPRPSYLLAKKILLESL
jgi:hypothetical protein